MTNWRRHAICFRADHLLLSYPHHILYCTGSPRSLALLPLTLRHLLNGRRIPPRSPAVVCILTPFGRLTPCAYRQLESCQGLLALRRGAVPSRSSFYLSQCEYSRKFQPKLWMDGWAHRYVRFHLVLTKSNQSSPHGSSAHVASDRLVTDLTSLKRMN